MELDLSGASYKFEAVGGPVDLVGFVEPNFGGDKAVGSSVGSTAEPPAKKAAVASSTSDKPVAKPVAKPEAKSVAKPKAEEKAKSQQTPEKAKPLEAGKTAASSSSSKTQEQAKPGSKSEKPPQGSEAKAPSQKEPQADFIASKKYTGSKPGMVFKKGAKGLGYYKDTYVPPTKGAKRKANDSVQPAGNKSAQPDGNKKMLQGGLMYEVIKATATHHKRQV